MNHDKIVGALVGALALALASYFGLVALPTRKPVLPAIRPAPINPAPAPQPRPRVPPCPGPGPCPRPRTATKRPPALGDKTSPDGTVEVAVDLPYGQLARNISSKGLGCCVPRSMEYAARWQQVPELYGLPEQMVAAGIAGGGWPEKVDRLMARFAPDAAYLQDTTGSLEILSAIIASGRAAAVTYNGHDPHYRGDISHMVCLVALDVGANWACILDNNYPQKDNLVWMGVGEFLTRYNGGGRGWCFTLLSPGPPPPPRPWASMRGWAYERDLAAPPPLVNRVLFGLDVDQLKGAQKRICLSGQAVSRSDALRAIYDGTLPADSAAPYLTVIGPTEYQVSVAALLASAGMGTDAQSRFRKHYYSPNDWPVVDCGFYCDPAGAIYIQTAAGQVAARLSGLPEPSRLLAAIRRADPLYQPDDDYSGQTTDVLPILPVAALAAGLYLIFARRESQKCP